MACGCVLAGGCSKSILSGADGSEWTNLLDAELSHWEVWTAVPHPSIKEFPEGYTLGEDAENAPAIGLGDPYQVYTAEQDADGELILRISASGPSMPSLSPL